MESSSAEWGGRVTNHPPSRPTGQANPPRHRDRARDHDIVAVRMAHYMPSAGPRARIFGPATTKNKACGFYTSRGVKGWGKEAKRNRARDIAVVAVRTANRPSKYRGAPNKTSRGVKGCTKLRRASEEQARIANKHQEEPSKYIEDWMQKEPSEYIEDWMAYSLKGCPGMGASSKVASSKGAYSTKYWSPERYQWPPKGCARYGISAGHRGAPER